ncbi:MAG: DUF6489 family protein [Gammaproteobacteria bacterium]|nr:DUF6489 family protein [Gammaproteobacteria bacterium]
MKIKVEIDATPEEMRRFFGMPDVQDLQEDLLGNIREKMKAGVEGYDPFSLLKPFLPENLRSMDAMQKAFWAAANPQSPDQDKK